MRRRLRRRTLRRFTGWVGRASDERLRKLMAGRLGTRILREVKRAMEQRFDPERAGDLEAVLEFWLSGRRHGRSDHWQVVIEAGRCRVSGALEREPDLVLQTDGASLLKLATGNAAGPELVVKGDLRLDGDLMLASRLPELFRRPRA